MYKNADVVELISKAENRQKVARKRNNFKDEFAVYFNA